MLYLDVYHASVSKVCLRCCFFALCHFDLTDGLAGTLLWDSGEPVSFVKEAAQSPGIRVGQDHPAMQPSASVSPGYASIQGVTLEDGVVAADLSHCFPSFLRLSSGSLGQNVLK